MASFGVVLYHLSSLLPPKDGRAVVERLFFGGSTGVSFFFILSGFVLAWGRQETQPGTSFYRRRFARVYPNHLLVFVFALIVTAVVHSAPSLAHTALVPLLLQAWVPDYLAVFAVNPVTWSLSCEIAYYAVFPWVARRIRTMTRQQRRVLIVSCVAAPSLIAALARPWSALPEWYWVAFFPPSRLPEFVLGVTLAFQIRDGWRPRIKPSVAVVAALVAMLAVGMTQSLRFTACITVIPYAAVIVAFASSDLRNARTHLHARPVIRLGHWSYAIFLVHVPVLYAVGYVIAPDSSAETAASWALVVLVSVAFGGAIYHFWERPFERLLRPDHRERTEERLL